MSICNPRRSAGSTPGAELDAEPAVATTLRGIVGDGAAQAARICVRMDRPIRSLAVRAMGHSEWAGHARGR